MEGPQTTQQMPPPQPTAPGAPPGGPPAAKTSGLAIAALVVGIVSVCFFWLPFVGLVVAIVPIILGAIAMKRIEQEPGTQGKGMAIAGLVLGSIMSLWGLVLAFLFILGMADFLEELSNELENAVQWTLIVFAP